MRSSVADYEVIEALRPSASGSPRYLCRPPDRLRVEGSVVVTELAVDASGWHQLADYVARVSSLGPELFVELLELSPDLEPGAAGVYLSCEHCPGGSLDEPAEPLEPGAAIEAVARAADAVHSMHEIGLTHGWIDGRAILLAERGAVIAPSPLDVQSGVLARFAGWRSVVTLDPDLLRGEGPSRSCDIWSLGATLHSALTSQPLYPGIDGEEPVPAVQRVLFERPVVDESLDRSIADLIRACLEIDPARRPPTAADVASTLRRNGASS